jgi:hypothetical protein
MRAKRADENATNHRDCTELAKPRRNAAVIGFALDPIG